MTVQMSRRHLFGAAAAASLVAAAAPALAKTEKVPAAWDEETDVLVVGSGFAGLAAAYEAAKAGSRVIVLEKMPTFGGNSIIDGGELTCVGSPQQKAAGIEDSLELWTKDTVSAGLGMNFPEKVKTLAENQLPNYAWLKDEIGCEFKTIVIQDGGHSVPRSVVAKNGSGSGFITPLLARCKEKGVDARTRAYVESIIRDPETGRVLGLKVRQGYRFPKEGSGKVRFIRAKKAVVLCHGGFGADVKFRSMQDPKLTGKFETTNQPGATAEMWREAARVGAMMIQTDWVQCVPWSSPYEKGMGILWTYSHTCAAPYGIWVDTATGKRFVNELANRKVRADAIMMLGNEGHKCIALTDVRGEQQLEKNRPGTIGQMLKCGGLVKFDSLEALAAHFNIPLKALQAEVDEFNANVRNKVKTDRLGKTYNPDVTEMKTAPWYAAELMPKVHHCMGGILTDANGQALDVSDMKPIPGLFAAGEATGGVHGAVRLGCNAILDCLVNGRIAGKAAAKAA